MHPIDLPLTFHGHPDQTEPVTAAESIGLSFVDSPWRDQTPGLLFDFGEKTDIPAGKENR
jgi:hypothetical protein